MSYADPSALARTWFPSASFSASIRFSSARSVSRKYGAAPSSWLTLWNFNPSGRSFSESAKAGSRWPYLTIWPNTTLRRLCTNSGRRKGLYSALFLSMPTSIADS